MGDTWAYGIQSDRKVATSAPPYGTVLHSRLLKYGKGRVITSPILTGPTPSIGGQTSHVVFLKVLNTRGVRYDMCYGGVRKNVVAVGYSTSGSDPDNPNAFPYYDIPGGMANSSGYANTAFHAARQDPNGYPAKHCEPSWADQTNWAVKWSTRQSTIEPSGVRLTPRLICCPTSSHRR